MKRIFLTFAVAVATACFATSVQAVPLNPGDTTTQIPTGDVSGTVYSSISAPFTLGSGSTEVDGFIRQVVVKESGGTYDFLYQLTVNQTSPSGATGFSVNGYTGANVDISQASTVPNVTDPNLAGKPLLTGTQPINVASRTTGTGNNLSFLTDVAPGQASNVLIVKTPFTAPPTNFTSDTAGKGGILSGSGGGTVFGLYYPGVAPNVPEPTMMALWGGSFVGLACVGAWRRRKAVTA